MLYNAVRLLGFRSPILYPNTVPLFHTLNKNKDPFIITQRGRAAAIMIGVEAYEESEQEKELLRLLVKGDKEIEMGEGYDLDTVLGDADALLTMET